MQEEPSPNKSVSAGDDEDEHGAPSSNQWSWQEVPAPQLDCSRDKLARVAGISRRRRQNEPVYFRSGEGWIRDPNSLGEGTGVLLELDFSCFHPKTSFKESLSIYDSSSTVAGCTNISISCCTAGAKPGEQMTRIFSFRFRFDIYSAANKTVDIYSTTDIVRS